MGIGGRDILDVRDRDQNNIFHLVPTPGWSQRMTEVLGKHLNKKKGSMEGTIPKTREDIVKRLLACRGEDPESQEAVSTLLNAANNLGETPIHVACKHNQDGVVQTLVDWAKEKGSTVIQNLLKKEGRDGTHRETQAGDYSLDAGVGSQDNRQDDDKRIIHEREGNIYKSHTVGEHKEKIEGMAAGSGKQPSSGGSPRGGQPD